MARTLLLTVASILMHVQFLTPLVVFFCRTRWREQVAFINVRSCRWSRLDLRAHQNIATHCSSNSTQQTFFLPIETLLRYNCQNVQEIYDLYFRFYDEMEYNAALKLIWAHWNVLNCIESRWTLWSQQTLLHCANSQYRSGASQRGNCWCTPRPLTVSIAVT